MNHLSNSMDKGKAKLSLDEMEVQNQSKKQKYGVSEDTLLLGGMSATRTPQTNLDTPSLRTQNFPARSSLTPCLDTPILSINQGQERTFPGLNPTKAVLAQRRRRENERQIEAPPMDVQSIQDRSWDRFVTPPVEEPMSNYWLGCRRWPPEKMVHKYFENHGFYSNALVEEGIIIRLTMRKYGIEPPFPF